MLNESFVEIAKGSGDLKDPLLSRLDCCLEHLSCLQRHQGCVYGGLVGLVEALQLLQQQDSVLGCSAQLLVCLDRVSALLERELCYLGFATSLTFLFVSLPCQPVNSLLLTGECSIHHSDLSFEASDSDGLKIRLLGV